MYETTITDNGPNGLDIDLLDDQTLYDPIYVDNQGLYFDGTSHIRTANTWTQTNEDSITIEGWIRPASATLDGTLLSFETAPNSDEASLELSGDSMIFDFGATSVTIPINYDGATDVDTWQYFGISLHKISSTQTRVCGIFGTGTEYCTTATGVLDLSGGNTMQVGKNFQGMIKDMSVLDWPRTGYEWTSQIQTAGCTPWNGVTCTHCPSTTGQCISTCEKDEYGNACTACLSPYCTSCYGGTKNQCFE